MRINNQYRFIFIIYLTIFTTTLAFSQKRIIGQIYDSKSGKTLANVNVLDKETNLKTVSDDAGNFQIATTVEILKLQFSKIGYEALSADFNVTSDTLIIFMNPSAVQLEEVQINTGYQWIPKESLTGSFVHINQEQLAAIPYRSIIDKLDGIMPGLQFDNRRVSPISGSDPVITVRGMNAFSTGGSRPLIVVDNFPYEGDIESINPHEVESVTLMRDAAATSIWGVRAGNGVLVINLKKPDQSGRTAISWSSNLSITQRPNLYYMPIMSSKDFVDVELFLYDKGHYRTALNGSNAHQTVFSPVVLALYDLSLGRIDEQEVNEIISRAKNHNYIDDMYDYVFRDAINQQHHFSISKRNGLHSMRFSAGIDQLLGQGNMAHNGADNRYSFNLSNSYQFNTKLHTELNVYYSLNKNKSGWNLTYPLNPGGGKTNMYPYLQLVDEQGNGLPVPNGLNPRFVDSVGNGLLLDWKYNPLEEMSLVNDESVASKVQPVLTIRYNPNHYLQLEAIYSVELHNTKSSILYDKNSYYVRDMVNRFTQINGTQVNRPVPVGDILHYSNSEIIGNKLRFMAKLNNSVFGSDRISWIIGSELSDVYRETKSSRVYGYNDFLRSSTAVDYVVQHPLFLGGRNNISYGHSHSFGLKRVVSFYSNFSYTLVDKYVLSGSARKDGSNVFGVKSNQRWNPLWSLGIAWNMHKEKFLKDIDWINSLKIKLTSGHSGNIGYGTNSDRAVITTSAVQSMTGLPSMNISTPANPSLKWENVKMNNGGLEFGILKNRVTGSIDYYRKKVTDLISNDPIDPTTGFINLNRNVGEIEGEGLDLGINIKSEFGQFAWILGTSYSYVRDWVKTYKGLVATTAQLVGNETSVFPIEGKPLVSVYSYRFAGLSPQSGDPQGYLNGQTSTNYVALVNDSLKNLVYHGSARPLYTGFVNNTLKYRNFSLFFNIAFRAGHYFRKKTINYSALFNSWSTHSDFSKRWIEPGDELNTTVPSMTYPANVSRDNFYEFSEVNVERGDVIRLQQIRLSYKKDYPKFKIKEMEFGLNVNNLGIIWKAARNERDPDFISIPPSRMISMNLGLKF